jgi:hypothetical protein
MNRCKVTVFAKDGDSYFGVATIPDTSISSVQSSIMTAKNIDMKEFLYFVVSCFETLIDRKFITAIHAKFICYVVHVNSEEEDFLIYVIRHEYKNEVIRINERNIPSINLLQLRHQLCNLTYLDQVKICSSESYSEVHPIYVDNQVLREPTYLYLMRELAMELNKIEIVMMITLIPNP